MRRAALPSAILVSFLLASVGLVRADDARPQYQDLAVVTEVRVRDLLSRMTLDEKVSQMMDVAPAIPRLGVPAYNWWNESLDGVARAGVATVFPQAIGLAATWDEGLMFRVADVISTEARAKHHDALRRGDTGKYKGLTMWSPNINIFRDPRWGRGQETYGEDPFLTSRMGVQFVKGLQGNDPKYIKVVSTPKHFAVHSGPEPDRHRFDAKASPRDLFDTYLPAFEATVREAGAWSVMCAYNRYEGQACCAHEELQGLILRERWGFKGYVVSDCGAITDIHRDHKLVAGPAEASGLAVRRGTDLECGNDYKTLGEAVTKGLVTEAELDVSLTRLFTARFRLGMFDPPSLVPYAQIPLSKNDAPEHRQLALEAARESIVLLKNDRATLPLRKDLKQILVVGPTADDRMALLGNYNGTPSRSVTPLQGIRDRVGTTTRVLFEKGTNVAADGPVYDLVPAAVLSFDGKPGLLAEYFDNSNLEGPAFETRIDPSVDSNWMSRPIPNLSDRQFSVRWTGEVTARKTGDHVLAVTGDDGYRLYLDDRLIIDRWTGRGPETKAISWKLVAGRAYRIRLDYFQSGGGAEASLLWSEPGADSRKNLLGLAQASDVVVFVGGLTPQVEGEEMRVPYEGFSGGDRTDIALPKPQQKLLETLSTCGKPVVLVLTSGSAVAVPWAKANVAAIVEIWYPGEEGGTALADILFGDANPGGRLPVTIYRATADLPPFGDYSMANRTYRYFRGEPLFPFGFGLSYTRFTYSDLAVAASATTKDSVTVSAKVTNAGDVAGDEVVQLYVRHLQASVPVPLVALQGFTRVRLTPGESRSVTFMLSPRQLSLVDEGGRRLVEPGEVEVSLGGGVPGRLPETSGSVSSRLTLTGAAFEVK